MKVPGVVAALALAASVAVSAQQTLQPVPQLPSSEPTTSSPRPEPPQPQAPVFRSGASIVALNVTVTDGSKRLVTGLRADDFAVFEDGIQQRVQFFEAADVPIDLILLIDTSSSMRDKMSVVHEAALGFLKTLRPIDRGAVVTFSGNVDITQPFTSDQGLLAETVRRTRAHGATALHNALYVALKEFGRSAQQGPDVRRQAIAVLSDGEDTSSLVSFDDVLAMARKTGVSIYTIRLQSEFSAQRASPERSSRYFSESAYSMKTLALDTGGQAFFPEAITELKHVYASIANELSAQYSIGYTPTNPRRDGRFRRVIVRILTNPTLRPRARAGYTADAERSAALIKK